MDVYHCLYLSRFTGRVGDTGLRDILLRAREHNVARGLTGALLFDGERFVQLLEGSRAEVTAMIERIRNDARHVDFRLVYEGASDQSRFKRWLVGYVEPDAVDALENGLTDAAAGSPVDQFARLLGGADAE